jgi:hypothetical protein
MPKTLPAALTTVMDAGVFDPYLKVQLFSEDPDAPVTVDVLSFKITDVTAECVIPYAIPYLSNACFRIVRGAVIAGTPSTIHTIWYVITSMRSGPQGIKLEGHALPPQYNSFDGCIWYMDVIDKICGNLGWMVDKTVTYENPAAAWLSYLFYPDGRNLTMTNMQAFFNLLAQKYLIFPAENCTGLFFFQATAAKAKDYDVTDDLLSYERMTAARRLLWRDELNTVHYSGSATNPVHNLGYIDSIQGAAPTNKASPKPFKSSKLPVHLKYRTGDVVKLGTSANYFQGRIKVTEVFDPKASPSWHVVLEPLCWFNSTEGGALPSTIEAAAPYTPLHTGYFNGILSAADNNIQSAMDTIDNHAHALLYAPIAKGVTNGDAHDHLGGDGGQVDHVNLANKGSSTHAALDTFLAEFNTYRRNRWQYVGQAIEHFDAIPGWTWLYDPTGTAGYKAAANSIFAVQPDDTNKATFFYQTGTTFAAKWIWMIASCGYNSEVGIRIDNGTSNEVLEFLVKYESAAKRKIIKRVTTGGVATSTDFVIGLPTRPFFLYLNMTYAAPNMSYGMSIRDDLGVLDAMGTVVISTATLNPSRYGILFTKATNGGNQISYVDAWSQTVT